MHVLAEVVNTSGEREGREGRLRINIKNIQNTIPHMLLNAYKSNFVSSLYLCRYSCWAMWFQLCI